MLHAVYYNRLMHGSVLLKLTAFLDGIYSQTMKMYISRLKAFKTDLCQALKPCKWLFGFIWSSSEFIRNLHMFRQMPLDNIIG